MKELRNSFYLNGHTLGFHPQTLSTINQLMVLFFKHFFFPMPTLGQNWSNKAVYSKARKLKSQNCYYKLLTVGRIYNSVLIYLELSRCNLFFVVFNHSRPAVFIHSWVTNIFTTQETCSFSSKLHSTISSFSLCTRYVLKKRITSTNGAAIQTLE